MGSNTHKEGDKLFCHCILQGIVAHCVAIYPHLQIYKCASLKIALWNLTFARLWIVSALPCNDKVGEF